MPDTSPLWTPDEVEKATDGEWLVRPPDDWDPIRVSYDVASLKGRNFVVTMNRMSWGGKRPDTAKELPKIVKSGAVGMIIQKEQQGSMPKPPPDFPILLVKSTRRALTDLCIAARERFEGKVIALTGTVGKTTTRQMLLHMLGPQGGASATRGNNNNIAGVERSMSYTPREHGYSILEMGFGRPLGGIGISSERVRPHVALITALGLAHLDVFGEMKRDEKMLLEMVATQKLGILDGLTEDGTLVINRDIERFDAVMKIVGDRAPNVITFGEHESADARLLSADVSSTSTRVTANICGTEVEYTLVVPGRHMAQNSVGALASVAAAGGDVTAAAASLAEFNAVGGRAQVFEIEAKDGKADLIDDSFNATPDSIRSTVDLLALFEPGENGRRIAVLGDILHLGPGSSKIHARLAKPIAASGVDKVFTIGPMMKHLHRALPQEIRGKHARDLADLYQAVRSYLKAGDVITVKASTPIGLGKVTKGLRQGSRRLQG